MSADSPRAEYTQEVRFAVVMYGGVSLAIYINGIAQELLRMVRSNVRLKRRWKALLIGLALLVVTAFVWPQNLKENTC